MPHSWDEQPLRSADQPLEPVEPGPSRRRLALGIVAATLIGVVAVALYLVFGRPPTPVADTAADVPPVVESKPPPSVRPLGGEPFPVDVPPLDETDALVRTLVKQLSSHPQVAAWLASEGRVRNFTLVVTRIAEGGAPAAQLRPLRPSTGFRTVERNQELYLDTRTYDRYTGLAEAVASIDPPGSARLYATLKPRIEEAHRELGHPEVPFDQVLERALILLLETPVQDGPIRLEPRGIVYGFADEDLEELRDAQKQLLRMGPRNGRTVQKSLRAIAIALGIPAERLPAPERP